VDATARMHSIDASHLWAFVVGAPRCGTTAVAKWLRGHPEVCLAKPKEPHFFAIHDLREAIDAELREIVSSKFVQRFFPNSDDASVLIDGSVSYLYAPERLEPALRLWPDAKFIICVRNPLQMVPSLHQRNIVNGDESVRNFSRAWSLVAERRRGQSIPRSCLDPRLLDYWEAGLLGKYVQNFLRVIGRERCLVIVFDDLVADARREYLRALDFLDLPDDGKTLFERHADSMDCRVGWLQRLLQRPPRVAMHLVDADDLQNPRFAETASPWLQKIIEVRSRIVDWNEVPAKRPVVEHVTIEEMQAMYAGDVSLLSEVLGRDLTHWLQAARPTDRASLEVPGAEIKVPA
jgi:hypothetical protein